MGVGQSSEKEKSAAPISSKFSTVELKKLEDFFQFKEQQSAESKGKWDKNSIKKRLSECFSSAIGDKVTKYFEIHTGAGDHANAHEVFLQLVFHLTKDCIKELADIIFNIVAEGDEIVTRDKMTKFLSEFIACFSMGVPGELRFTDDAKSSEKLAEKLVEHCPEKVRADDLDVVLHRTPLLIDLLQYKFRMVFFDYISEASKEVQGTMPFLIPDLDISDKSASTDTFILTLPSMVYLNSRISMQLQHKWRLLYSSKLHGESFSKLTGAIIDKGPTLLVIRDTNGHVFGGYASTSWVYSSEFQGTDKSFLFTAEPSLNIYDCLGGGYNDHYMYLNIGQETMPNGLGMGGQFEFFGLWLDHEFGQGHSKAKPLCTTYKSPQLSHDENFKIEAINVWGIGEEPKKTQDEEYNEEMTSVLDKHVEAKALLEIAGKPRVSEGLRDAEPDCDIPETKELQHAHDPMT